MPPVATQAAASPLPRVLLLPVAAGALALLAGLPLFALASPVPPASSAAAAPATTASPAPASAAASPQAARARGVDWLLGAQHRDGGWGAGSFGEAQGAQSDAATTAMSVLALARDGGVRGPHRAAIERGVAWLCEAVEQSPKGEPRLRTPQGTQPQGKLGQLVDTHMTALALGQVAGQLPPTLDARVQVALDAVVGKVQLAQRADGSFDGEGWAPVLSNSVAAMSLVQAQEKGVAVAPEALSRADRWQDGLYDESSGSFDASTGAGVDLYSVASSMRMDSQARERGYAGAGKAEEAARQAVQGQAADRLIAGFGSVGGEEMLSYMMISDTLAEQGGKEWTDWDARIGGWLASIQNADGSWSGHHCITSQTFVTATALLTLGAGEHAGRGAGLGRVAPREPGASGATGTVFGGEGFGLRR